LLTVPQSGEVFVATDQGAEQEGGARQRRDQPVVMHVAGVVTDDDLDWGRFIQKLLKATVKGVLDVHGQ
jgi:hypothetical protein